MIAERKKPLLITYPKVITAGRNVELQSDKIEKDFLKSRYEARRKFFQDLERQTQKSQESVISSKANAANMNNIGNIENNNEENISQENFAVIPTSYTEVYNSHLIKKNMKENLNDQVHWNIIMHSVKRENIAQPSFVKVINLGETKSSTKKKSLISRGSNEKSNNVFELFIDIDEKQQQQQQQHLSETMTKTTKTGVILTRNCVEVLQCDSNGNNEESSQSLSNSSFNYDKYSVNCECDNHRSMTEINIIENKKVLLDKINDNAAHIELKEQSVRSWIENSICKNNWTNDIEADIYDSYCNDITKIVESIDLNITSSKTELDALPDTNTCIKYNLDSTNMSLIYSLTPPAAIDQEENDNDDTSWDLAERSSEWQSDSMRSDSCEALGDYIWIEPITKDDSIKLQCPQDGTISSVSSCDLELGSERHSANGSDILELPSCTISELKDIDGEVFQNGINESANEIIANLNTSDEILPYDALQIVQHIIAEIIESVYILSYLDSSIYDLGVIKEIVRRLIDGYHYEYLLTEFANRARVTDVRTNDNDDNICRIKGFLGNLSSDFHYTNQIKIQEKEDQGYSAVIEFCTVAKKLPVVTIDDKTLELNFRILKVSRNEYIEKFPNTHKIFCNIDDSMDNDNKQTFIESDEICSDKAENKDAAIIKSDIETWLFDRYPYDQEEEEIMQKKCRLTPISEEPVMEGETPCETIDSVITVLENHNNESSHNSEINFVNAVEENIVNSTTAPVSLDGTYTISEISDNDETNDFQEHCDIWDLSIDCMSYSYDTKEFIRLEKALADGS